MKPIDLLCERVGIDVPPGWSTYFELVHEWGARTDLTSAKTEVELSEILFLDAANLIRAGWMDSVGSVVDIGAGVGAPTIPLLLGDEEARCVLVEPRRRRVAFLRSAIGTLELSGRAEVLEVKVDPRSPGIAGVPFDVALSRATFEPDTWRSLGLQLATEVWIFTAGAELTPSAQTTRRLNYDVPSSGAPRSVFAVSG